MSDREQSAVSDDVLNLKLDHLQSTLDEVKTDVREIKNESPILRIRQLEDRYDDLDGRWGRLVWFLALLFLALAGAYATAFFTR